MKRLIYTLKELLKSILVDPTGVGLGGWVGGEGEGTELDYNFRGSSHLPCRPSSSFSFCFLFSATILFMTSVAASSGIDLNFPTFPSSSLKPRVSSGIIFLFTYKAAVFLVGIQQTTRKSFAEKEVRPKRRFVLKM